jgi:lysophospholipase L1-like esterase
MNNNMPKEDKAYRWIKVLVFNLVFFILLLMIGEIALRIINPSYTRYVRTHPGQYRDHYFNKNATIVNWSKKDNFLGWVCNDTFKYLKFVNKTYNKLKIAYDINLQGFRHKTYFTVNAASKSNILMLGDSFLFGVYLKENEVITSLLEDKFNNKFKFINLGIPGYGIDQMYLSYIKFNKIIKPKVVILFYIDDDIYRTYDSFRFTEGMNKPSFYIKDENLVHRNKDNPSIIEIIFQRSYLLNPFYKEYSYNQSKILAIKIFENLIRDTKIFRQKLLIVRCPTDYQIVNDDKSLNLSFKKIFTEDNFYYYEMFEDLKKMGNDKIIKMYLENDGHLSPYGTEIVSKLLYKKINEIEFLIK